MSQSHCGDDCGVHPHVCGDDDSNLVSVFEQANVSENIVTGNWSFNVSGYSVSGSQAYYMAAYFQ